MNNYVAYNDPGSVEEDDDDFGYDMGADLARFYSAHRNSNDNPINGLISENQSNQDSGSTSFNDNSWLGNQRNGMNSRQNNNNNGINITVPSRHTQRRRQSVTGSSRSSSSRRRSNNNRPNVRQRQQNAAQQAAQQAARAGAFGARYRISREDVDPEVYAEMKDREAKLAAMFPFEGDDILDVKKMSGINVERNEGEERQMEKIIENLPELMKEFNQNKIDLPTLYKKMQNDLCGGSSDEREQGQCKICDIASLNPLGFSQMSAFMAMKMVEIEMVGNVNADQLTLNKRDVFNMYQIGLHCQGGKCTTLITTADVERHNGCSNDILCIQNDIVTILRRIMVKLSSQISGNIMTPVGPMPYINSGRIKVLTNVMSQLERMVINFLNTKRCMRNAMFSTGSVLEALTTVGHARTMVVSHAKNGGGADAQNNESGGGAGFGAAFGLGKSDSDKAAAFGAGGNGAQASNGAGGASSRRRGAGNMLANMRLKLGEKTRKAGPLDVS